MTAFKTPKEVWSALAAVTPGKARADIIAEGQNRDLILNSGSFVIFSIGELRRGAIGAQSKLKDLEILQTQRLRTLKDGSVIMDGKGTFGGLSERSMRDEKLTAKVALNLGHMEGMTLDAFLSGPFKAQLQQIIKGRDDLKVDAEGRVSITADLTEIALTTAARETMEEAVEVMAAEDVAAKLGMDKRTLHVIFKQAAMTRIPLQNVRDDNYVINIWGGDLGKPAFAVSPFGHMAEIDEHAFQKITGPGEQKMREGLAVFANEATRPQLKGREILGVEGVPLFECLKKWGKPDGKGGRDLSSDYRYPHEWMGTWRRAQIALGLERDGGAGMVDLMAQVQISIIEEASKKGEKPYNVDLFGALVQMNGGSVKQPRDINRFDIDFDLPEGTFIRMHLAGEKVMTHHGHPITNRLVSYLDGCAATDFVTGNEPFVV